MTIITKEQKQEYSDKYFNGMKPKELSEITYTTPQDHKVKALISRKPNRYLGSLLILQVDNEPVEQFIQGMPKIHYLDNYHMIKTGDEYTFYDVYEKLDGTNICLYGLKDHNGELIEVVAKSRNMGVLDKEFHKLYLQTDHHLFEEYIQQNPNHNLYFELYGMGNLHSIKHMETYLDLKLLGAFDGENFIEDQYLNKISNRRPTPLFRIYNIQDKDNEGYTFYINSIGLCTKYRGYTHRTGLKCKNMEECVDYIKDTLEELNTTYQKHNNRLAIEGAVINGISLDDHFTYIKVKPDTIEMAHKSENGIPRQYIMKEIMKYLDEHKSDALETWNSNPNEVMDYLNRNLAESFEEPYIIKSQNKIKRLFDDKVNPAPTPEEIIKIGDELLEEYPNKSITDLMRIFGQNYPSMKKQGGKLYKYLESNKK